ncbi:MAG: hypothetical protein HKN87_08245 [Saprospiraceae bacterium]|nr:hypothetical protein [Saprospiraceae bacterium]
MKQHFVDVKFEVVKSNKKSHFFEAYFDAEKASTNPGNRVQIIADSEILIDRFFGRFGSYQFPFRQVHLTRVGKTSDHLSSLIPMLNDAIKEDTNTIVLSSKQPTIKACYDAFQFAEKYFSVVLAQPYAGKGVADVFMELRQPWLHRLSLVGTQAHRVNEQFLDQHQDLGLNTYRLGALRREFGQMEPDLRNADLCGIDLNAMKYADAPIQQVPSAIGLTTEEMSQIAYYAGRAERNKVYCIYGFSEDTMDSVPLGTDILASLVWYYLHGLENRNGTYPPDMNRLNAYVLDQQVADMSLTFYKDESNQKWWLASPYKERKLTQLMPIIACDYQEYALAANEQMLSDRLQSIIDLYEQSPPVESQEAKNL